MAFAVKLAARLLLFPPEGGLITTRQASLNAADRLVAPPKGLSTLGFDPARFQTEPPACYRASWQLPGRDSHPLATTSLCWITIYISTSNSGHTASVEQAPYPPLAESKAVDVTRRGASRSTPWRCAPLAKLRSAPIGWTRPASIAREVSLRVASEKARRGVRQIIWVARLICRAR